MVGDPLALAHPDISNFEYANNNPIVFRDLPGLDSIRYNNLADVNVYSNSHRSQIPIEIIPITDASRVSRNEIQFPQSNQLQKQESISAYRIGNDITPLHSWLHSFIVKYNPLSLALEVITGRSMASYLTLPTSRTLALAKLSIILLASEAGVIDAELGYGAAEEVTSLEKASGSYLFEFQSGKFYAGKGLESRMMQSIKRIESTGDLLRPGGAKFFPASSTRETFINEYNMMKNIGLPTKYDPNSLLYNKIWSPGKKLLEQ